jgi:hypothetical protein
MQVATGLDVMTTPTNKKTMGVHQSKHLTILMSMFLMYHYSAKSIIIHYHFYLCTRDDTDGNEKYCC